MFNFFSKKHFLVDYLGGFVDIHNHILPGLDDGSKNVEESIALIKGMGEFGVSNFICTPHIMENYYPNTAETIANAHTLLNGELKKRHMDHVIIRYAAEHMIDSQFELRVEQGKVMPLATNYILIEMSYLQPSLNFDSSVAMLKERKMYPILAHPERYAFLHKKFVSYSDLRNLGIMFQLNLLSLSSYYGKEVQKAGMKLLEEGLIDFLGSDIHNMKQLAFLRELTLKNEYLKLILPLLERTSYNFNQSYSFK